MQLRVENKSSEIFGPAKRLEDRTIELRSEVDFAGTAIGEATPDDEITNIASFNESVHGSLQRLNRAQGLMCASALPIVVELCNVCDAPLQHMRKGSLRQVAPEDLAIANADSNFVVSVCRVKVRRVMVVVKHPNDDAEESADFGHSSRIPVCSQQGNHFQA